jgi:integrase
MNISVYTRHEADCPKRKDRYWKRCKCPKWLYYSDARKRVSAKTRSWEKAKSLAVEANAAPESADPRMTVEQATKLFIEDKRQQQSGDDLIDKLTRLLEVRFVKWCTNKPVVRIVDVSLADLEEFRKTWPGAALYKKKMQELLRSFFNYCIRHDWVKKNPAALLSKIRVDAVPTDYFTPAQFDKIITACETYRPTSKRLAPRREKVKAMTLLMRWSGLRIGDAIKLERVRLTGNKLLLRTEKTGTPVWCPIPPAVAEMLRSIENRNPAYFFWTGNGTADSAYSDWHRTFESVFKEAKLGKRCNIHQFRDTFAVEMLLAGVPLEQVSMLLGHRSTKTTEKHYLPWVSARQEQLEESVKKAWKAHEKKSAKKAKAGM